VVGDAERRRSGACNSERFFPAQVCTYSCAVWFLSRPMAVSFWHELGSNATMGVIVSILGRGVAIAMAGTGAFVIANYALDWL